MGLGLGLGLGPTPTPTPNPNPNPKNIISTLIKINVKKNIIYSKYK